MKWRGIPNVLTLDPPTRKALALIDEHLRQLEQGSQGDDNDQDPEPKKAVAGKVSSAGMRQVQLPGGEVYRLDQLPRDTVLVVTVGQGSATLKASDQLKLNGDATLSSPEDAILLTSLGTTYQEVARVGPTIGYTLGCPTIIKGSHADCFQVQDASGNVIFDVDTTTQSGVRVFDGSGNVISVVGLDASFNAVAGFFVRGTTGFSVNNSTGSQTYWSIPGDVVSPHVSSVSANTRLQVNTDWALYGQQRFSPDSTNLTADASPLPVPTAAINRLTSNASYSIRGIGADTSGIGVNDYQRITLINANAAFDLTLENEDPAVSAADRIITGTGSPDTIVPDTTRELWYDSTSSRWRVIQPGLKAFGGYVEVSADFTITSETDVVVIPSAATVVADAVIENTAANGLVGDVTASWNASASTLFTGTAKTYWIGLTNPWYSMTVSDLDIAGSPFIDLHWRFGGPGFSFVRDTETDATSDFTSTGTNLTITFPDPEPTWSAASTSWSGDPTVYGPYYWRSMSILNNSYSTNPHQNSGIVFTAGTTVTLTLPLASTRGAGSPLKIIDGSGDAGLSPITIQRQGSDTINHNDLTQVFIQQAGGARRFISDGVSKWYEH